MRRMRWLLCGLAVIGMTQQARAADLSDMFLRGSSTVITAPGGADLGRLLCRRPGRRDRTGHGLRQRDPVADPFMLRKTTIENEQPVSRLDARSARPTPPARAYGGFVGYNWQWDQAVVGVEGSYNRTDLHLSSTDAMRRIFSTVRRRPQRRAGQRHRLGAHDRLRHGARARAAGRSATSCRTASLGLAVGRADVTRARVTARLHAIRPTGADHPVSQRRSDQSETKNGAFAYGYAVGLGVDMALMQNVFVRAEYEYVQFGGSTTSTCTSRRARRRGFKF